MHKHTFADGVCTVGECYTTENSRYTIMKKRIMTGKIEKCECQYGMYWFTYQSKRDGHAKILTNNLKTCIGDAIRATEIRY